jgi:hypothetical protein
MTTPPPSNITMTTNALSLYLNNLLQEQHHQSLSSSQPVFAEEGEECWQSDSSSSIISSRVLVTIVSDNANTSSGGVSPDSLTTIAFDLSSMEEENKNK